MKKNRRLMFTTTVIMLVQLALPTTAHGLTTMEDTGCELVAMLKAMNKIGKRTKLSDIANYY